MDEFFEKCYLKSKQCYSYKMNNKKEDSFPEETLPFVINYLPHSVSNKAYIELNETPENKVKGLKELQNLAREHSITCDINFNEDFLVQFLRKRKYDVPRAFKQLLTVTKFIKRNSYLMRRLDLDQYFRQPSTKLVTILPRRCPDGCAIILIEMGKWIPSELPLEDLQTFVSTVFWQSIRDPMTQINGYKVIVDGLNIPFSNFRYFTPYNIHLFYQGAIECIPGRYKVMVAIVNSTALRIAFEIFKGFAPKKLKERIFLKTARSDVLEYFSPSLLPVQYGGTLEDYFMTEWLLEANESQAEFGFGGQKNYY